MGLTDGKLLQVNEIHEINEIVNILAFLARVQDVSTHVNSYINSYRIKD